MTRPINTLMAQVQDTIKTHGMLERTRRVVVAFSGGPDSVCLLDVLYRLYRSKIDLHLVYINHGLRPMRVLQREERMVMNYAHDYDIPYQTITVKVSRGKTGLEAAARHARYAALHACMREVGADRIAMGHNLDDVIETFFMNLIRGSGIRGLQAIPPVRLSIIRPLIDVRKREVLAYIKRRKLSYSVDATNILPEFRRNMLRHRIIPQLLKMNPELHAAIQREITLLRQDDACLEHQAKQAYSQVAHREKNDVLLDIKRLLEYNPAVRSRILMRAVFAVQGSLEGFESKHFKAILGLTGKATSKRVNLVKGLRAQRSYDHIIIGKARPSKRVMVYLDPECDSVVCNDMRVTVKKVQQCKIIPKKPNCEVFDLDQLVLPLFIRSRTTGDHVETKTGRQKMKKIFNEFKIPPHKRDRHVLLCDQQGILWVLGLKRAYRAFINEGSRNMVVVEIENIDRRT
jgi:tRNA(Ile)-lysidine synthase